MVCRYSFTGPAGNEITLEGIPALKAYLATGGLQYLLPDSPLSTALATDQLSSEIGVKKSEMGTNKLNDPEEYALALKQFVNYYGNEERAKEQLDYYKRDVDALIKNGGKVYRAVYADSVEQVDLQNPGRHWTTSDANFEDFFESGTFYDAYGRDKIPFIIEATVAPNGVTNEKVDIAGNPNESEVNLVSGTTPTFKVFEYDNGRLGKPLLSTKRTVAETAGPQLSPPRFYSQLERSLAGAKQDSAPAGDWKAIVSKLPGVKKDEIEWSGVNDYLTLRGKEKVTKAELDEFLNLNGVKIDESMRGDQDKYWDKVYSALDSGERISGYSWDDQNGDLLDSMDYRVETVNSLEDAADYVVNRTSDTDAEYAQYQLPGGTKYKELLITLPFTGKPTTREQFTVYDENNSAVRQGTWPPTERTEAALREHPNWRIERRTVIDQSGAARRDMYRSPHWQEPNVLAHIRMNDRKDADGNNVLFIEELQSDWAQAGRKGGIQGELTAEETARVTELRNQRFALDRTWRDSEDPVLRRELSAQSDKLGVEIAAIEERVKGAVPAAPFISNTKDWVALGVKRILLLAAQGNYDKVAFVTGKQSADRYNLAKQIDYIEYEKTGDNDWFIKAIDHTGRAAVTEYKQSPADLENLVGKEVAQKIVDNEGSREPGEPATYGTLRNTQLEVGGEGMKSFYDRIVPQVVNDVIKKLGGRMESVSIETADKYEAMKTARAESGLTDNQWNNLSTSEQAALIPSTATAQPGFTITPEMREKLQGEGLPLFSTKRAQTKTAEFKRWFGDSKVVDANGEPLVVYHGSNEVFDVFSAQSNVYWFSDSKTGAESQGSNVISAYLRIENPYQWKQGDPEPDAKGFRESLIEQGYDGIFAPSNIGETDYIMFSPEQIKSATGNVGTFSPETPDIRYSNRRAFGTLTPEQEAALNKVGGLKVNATIRERLMDLKNSFQKSWQQGIFDQFAPLRQLSQEAYMKARLSKGSDGTLEALMLYGKPFINKDGIPDVNINDRGFAKTLASLKGEHDRFLWWVAAQRAGMLKMQGLENLFDYGDISALLDLNQGNFADGTQRAPVYAKALKELNEFNDAVLKVAVDSGLVDPKAQAMFKDMPYVPFYRVMEGGNMTGPKFSSGLVNQTAWKRLKGGTQQLNSDLLTNMLLNWSHLYTASANNRAAVASLQAAAQAQIAYEVPAGTKKSVRVMVGGDAYHYVIEDPYLMEAVSALEYVSPSFFKPFSMFKRWLTVAVTANPAFKIRNLIRDSLSAIGTAELSANPFANVKQGIGATSKEGQTYASMLAGGGVIRFGSMIEGDRAHQARALVEREGGRLLDKTGWEKLSGQMMTVLHTYNELGDRMENVNRAALYEQLIKKGYSTAEANFMARDLMDFSMSGKWPVVRFLAQVVPFMNARLQGLYKLGRSAKENPARFGYTVGAVALASIALMLAYEDDEDWKKRPDWDRDSNWWFKIGGIAFRIPKPFEIGAMGTMAERTWELFFNDEMTGKRYRERISNMIFDTFAMDPTPQIVKPLLDVYSNKAGFTGRPIETMGMQKLRPEDRFTAGTSQVAKFLGQLGLPDPAQLAKGEYKALSPVQVDYLLRGYFGWIGTSAVSTIDYIVRPMTGQGERPDMRLKDVFLLGNFVETLPSGSSRYVDQMYQQANLIEQAYASWRDAQKRGDYAAAKDIFEEEKEKIVKYKQVEKVKDRVTEINARIKQIQSSTSLSGETKRRMIDTLELQKDQAARAFPVAR